MSSPFKMTLDDAIMFVSGGAEPGSVRHEEAKEVLAWHRAQTAPRPTPTIAHPAARPLWSSPTIIIAAIAAAAAVASAIAAFL
jgi:hypothetical protein